MKIAKKLCGLTVVAASVFNNEGDRAMLLMHEPGDYTVGIQRGYARVMREVRTFGTADANKVRMDLQRAVECFNSLSARLLGQQ